LDASRIKILGCGSTQYAGLAGAQLVKSLACIPADAEPAAEFRYRNPAIEVDTIYIAVSQSGETLDTLVAAMGSLQEIKAHHGPIVTVTPGWSEETEALADHSVTLPECTSEVSTIVMAVALQLPAYHTDLWIGRDIDQPRNLTKSVTVE